MGAIKGTAAVGIAVVALPVLIVLFLLLALASDNFGATAAPAGAAWCGGISTDEIDLNAEQASVATTIVAVVEREGFPPEAAVIALSVALVEADLLNVDYGDRDSLGVFQQRPSQGWGTPEQVMDVELATEAFLGVAEHVDKAGLAGFDWQSMEPGRAAQVVQASAYPTRYSERMAQAQAVYAAITGGTNPCGTTTGAGMVAVPAPGGGTIDVDASIATNLAGLLAHAEADGLALSGSGWRSPERTAELRVINGCPDVYRSPASSCRVPTAIPGRSMHEQGLAVDFANCNTRATACYRWLAANAATYGLINLPSEPWHWSLTGR